MKWNGNYDNHFLKSDLCISILTQKTQLISEIIIFSQCIGYCAISEVINCLTFKRSAHSLIIFSRFDVESECIHYPLFIYVFF